MTEIHFDFLNLNSLLIILLILLIGGYLYYEIYKLKVIIELKGQEKPACIAEFLALAYNK